ASPPGSSWRAAWGGSPSSSPDGRCSRHSRCWPSPSWCRSFTRSSTTSDSNGVGRSEGTRAPDREVGLKGDWSISRPRGEDDKAASNVRGRGVSWHESPSADVEAAEYVLGLACENNLSKLIVRFVALTPLE